MDRQQLKNLQAPLKELYQQDPTQAVAELRAVGIVDLATLTCSVQRPPGDATHVIAGLHPKAGGDNSVACSGDMLMQALATCAGVTLAAVSVSMGLDLQEATVEAIGTMDFRGTLGVSRDVPCGLTSVVLNFHLRGNASTEQLDKLVQLVERYCVVLNTLQKSVSVSSHRITA